MDDAASDVQVIAMLPCGDIDELATFWTALGLTVTYRQLRPNPFLALERGAHRAAVLRDAGLGPREQPLDVRAGDRRHRAAARALRAGLRDLYGKVPVSGFPRMTRPRRRANNAGLSGFSLIDPGGNWIRVTARPDASNVPRTENDRGEWVSEGGGPLARALENAVCSRIRRATTAQAERALSGAVRRHPDAPAAEAAPALTFLAELRERLGDLDGAREAASALRGLDAPGRERPPDRET